MSRRRFLMVVATVVLYARQALTMVAPQKVAIIGGGIAGLSCAQHLGSSTYEVTVFDTGRLRPGGRCSSREAGDVPKEDDMENPILSKYRFDHAAQLIAVPKSLPDHLKPFNDQLQTWKDEGIVTECSGVYTLQSNCEAVALSKTKFYHGANGMGSIPLHMAKRGSFSLQQDVWVSPSSGVRYQKETNRWKLVAKGQTLGIFDKLVIAHNGKCADRIMSKTPAKDIHKLLRVNFAPTVPNHGGYKMTLNSLYSLTIALPPNSPLMQSLPRDFVSGFVQSHPDLRMLTCQTRKYSQKDQDVEVWTILSSAKFAKKYKAPQEFLPEDVQQNVTKLLLSAVETSIIGHSPKEPEGGLLQPLDVRVQLWGAAVPLNVWSHSTESKEYSPAGYLYDAKYQVGVCGDWLVEPSIGGAWTSGQNLAKHLLDNPNASTDGLHDETLSSRFRRSNAAGKLGIAALATS